MSDQFFFGMLFGWIGIPLLSVIARRIDKWFTKRGALAMSKSQYKPSDEPWVIVKGGSFYRSDFCGYTNHIEAAGIYTEDEAKSEAMVEPKNMAAYPLSKYRNEIVRNRDTAQSMLDVIEALNRKEGDCPAKSEVLPTEVGTNDTQPQGHELGSGAVSSITDAEIEE